MGARLKEMASRIRAWLRPATVDEDFERELESHLDMLAEENVKRGMPPGEARRAARIRLGGTAQLRQTNRDLRGLPVLEELLQDVRYASRMLRRNPGFTLVAVLTLALGIGANTAIFSVVYAVLLKPLPYAHAEQLFNVFQQQARDASVQTGWSYLNFAALREQNHAFEDMAGVQFHQLTMTGRGEPAVVDTSVVTPELFSVLGQQPLAGRAFLPEDGKPGAPGVVILSEGIWRSQFGSDPQALGASITLDMRPFTIVGIMPDAFRYPAISKARQIWIPLAQDPLFGPWMANRGGHWLQVTGRLRPGITLAKAQAELDGLAARLAKEFPAENDGWVIRTIPLQGLIVMNVRPALLMLSGAVGLVLLIACANIANLLLARATTRAREIAVRTTLGAGRARIVRQLLSETAVLGVLGGVAGVALAYWGVQALTALLPASVPRVNAIRIDATAFLFALLLATVASCLFGLTPAFLSTSENLQGSLREGGSRAGESPTSGRARRMLAAAEVALAMVLLVAAGLLLRSFAKLTAMSPGFDPQQVVKAEISLPRAQYSSPRQWVAFADDLLARVQAQPGLHEAAVAIPVPIANHYINLGFDIAGRPAASTSASRTANYVAASPGYLRVMGIPVLSGRFFDDRDTTGTARVCVISRAMARIYFPGEDPIGQSLQFAFPPDTDAPREIVGVVGDVRDVALGAEPGPMMYAPFAQAPFAGVNVIVKSTLGADAVAAAIRRQSAEIDKNLPVSEVAYMPEAVEASTAQPRFRTLLLGIFAAMALVLAATGIFGVISYSVSRRTQEIGVRMAMGASRAAILRMVLRETLGLTVAGLAVGIPCSLAASRLVGNMLFGVPANDPATLAAVVATLAGSAVLAGYLPAQRAMRVDPMIALRHE